MDSFATLHAQRLQRWHQTTETHIVDTTAAAHLIEQMSLVTLYPVSSEIPNLFHAYLGDPEAQTDSGWDTPSGEVYTWRWLLGRQNVALYTALIRRRPTWIHWILLPAIIRLCGELRTPDELYTAGVLSSDARRIAQVLATSRDALSTGELRKQAGFPTGTAYRAAYLKAVEELDSKLLLAKVFSSDGDQMSHALVSIRYPETLESARGMTEDDALDSLLRIYLPYAVYAVPPTLAKHLNLNESKLRATLDRFVQRQEVTSIAFPEHKHPIYVWQIGL